MNNSKFIVFEGLDGCGKTTQAKMLVDYLNNKNIKSEFTFEPTNSIIGNILRSNIEGKLDLDKHTRTLLFAADRIHHIFSNDGIINKLNKNITIVCDRYYLSNFAYQLMENDNLEYLKTINSYVIKPNIIFFIDTIPGICIRRKNKDKFENLNTLRNVYVNYLSLIDKLNDNIIIIEDDTIDNMHSEIVNIVNNLLGVK